MEDFESVCKKLKQLEDRIERSDLTLCNGCDLYFGGVKMVACEAKQCNKIYCQGCYDQHGVETPLYNGFCKFICNDCFEK